MFNLKSIKNKVREKRWYNINFNNLFYNQGSKVNENNIFYVLTYRDNFHTCELSVVTLRKCSIGHTLYVQQITVYIKKKKLIETGLHKLFFFYLSFP